MCEDGVQEVTPVVPYRNGRLVVDNDGDIWAEVADDVFDCATQKATSDMGLFQLKGAFGPLRIYILGGSL